MPISLIPPMLGVLEDQRVTTAELNWFIQEGIMIVIMAVMMTAFWGLVEESIEG